MPSFFEQMETTPNGAASLQITNEMEVEAGESEIQAARHATFPPSDLHGISTIVPRFQELSISAKAATEAERRMTFLAGCRLYPKAIAWSTLLASAIIMEAYDKSLVSNFFGFPEFRRTYGNPVDKNAPQNSNVYEISAAWQSGLNNAALAGEIIGLFANGIITDRIGYRHTSIAALVWLAVWIFLAFFSVNIQTLLASQVLCGKSCSVPGLA